MKAPPERAMSEPRFEIVRTTQGAPALRDVESGEVMHPGLGPLHEAQALYITPSRLCERLAQAQPEPLVLLDLGLGAGTNALCALSLALAHQRPARRLEMLSLDLTSAALRHAFASGEREAFGVTANVREAVSALLDQHSFETERVSWRLVLGDACREIAALPEQSIDLVFWDPYSPRTNPSMWSERAFALLRRVCRDGATVHTYSGATATRSALLLAGFYVGLGPNVGERQRRATLAATRLADLAAPLDHTWLAGFPRPVPGILRDPALSCEARARLERLPQLVAKAIDDSAT
jgi:queuine tRNA-ribosyltransferase